MADLAHEARDALPKTLVQFLDTQSRGRLKSITWIEPDRLRFTAHFEKDGQPLESRIFKYKAPLTQSKSTR
jgi:hypothetical protein